MAIALYGSGGQGWGLAPITMSVPGPDISVFAGETVTLSLVSLDGAQHNFGLDYNGNGRNDPGEPISPLFSTTTNYQFNTTGVVGNYTYWCYLHPNTMHGRFRVLEKGLTVLSVVPEQARVMVGQSFRVDARVASVQDLYAYNVTLRFDPHLVKATNADIDFVRSWMNVSGLLPSVPLFEIDNLLGLVRVRVWVQGTYPGLTGYGSLLSVEFVSISSGSSPVGIDGSGTVFLDSQFRGISYSTVNGSVAILDGRPVDVWTEPRILRLAWSSNVTVAGVFQNTGALAVYVLVTVSWRGSRSGVGQRSYGPTYLSGGSQGTLSVELALPNVTERYHVEVRLLLSDILLAEGDPGWVGLDPASVSFQAISHW